MHIFDVEPERIIAFVCFLFSFFSHSLTPCCPIVVWDCVLLFMLWPTGPKNRSPFSILFKLRVRPPQRRWHGIVESNKPNLLYRSRLHMQQKMTNFFSLTRLPCSRTHPLKLNTQHYPWRVQRRWYALVSRSILRVWATIYAFDTFFQLSFGYERFNHWHWVAKRSRQLRILTRMRKRSCDAEDSREMKNGNWFIFERCSTWMIDCSFPFFFSLWLQFFFQRRHCLSSDSHWLFLSFFHQLYCCDVHFSHIHPQGWKIAFLAGYLSRLLLRALFGCACVHCIVLSGWDFDATRKAN